MSVVDQDYRDAILASPVTRILRKVDIYEADGETLYAPDVKITDGSVSVDQTRSERRTVSFTLRSDDQKFIPGPDSFWYDKIIKVSRGVRTDVGDYLSPLGTFMVDSINRSRFPNLISVSGRDLTKKLMLSKFAVPTAFSASDSLVGVIRTIAINGGIAKFIFPNDTTQINRDFYFEKGKSRWEAITELATAFSYEIFFDVNEYLVLQKINDPTTTPHSFTFRVGEDGVISNFTKSTNDSQLFNHIGVSSESNDTIPFYAEAINNNPQSPTRVERIGDRYWDYSSAFITSEPQAQQIADDFLRTMALEQFDVNIESLVIPWFEAGEIVRFEDPEIVNPYEPTQFLLSSFTIPLGSGLMSNVCKRITLVG